MDTLTDKCKKLWFDLESRKKIRRNGGEFSKEECEKIDSTIFWLDQKKDNIKEKVMYIAHEMFSPLECPITNKKIILKNPLYRTYSDEMIKNKCFLLSSKIKIKLNPPFFENYSKTEAETILTSLPNNVAIRCPMLLNHCWISLREGGFDISQILSNEEAFYIHIKKIKSIPKCSISNKNRKFCVKNMKYYEYSSRESANKATSILHKGKSISEKTLNKRETTMIERYGVSSPLKLKTTRDKSYQTRKNNSLLRKYQKEIHKDDRSKKEKWLDSIKKKYNVSSYKEYVNTYQKNSIEKSQQELKLTLKRKYGVDKLCDIPNIRDKIKDTNIKKYGVSCFINSPKYQEKKKIQLRIDTYNNFSRFGEKCEPMFTLQEWLIGYNKKLPWKKIDTGKIFNAKYWGYEPIGKFKYSSLEQSICNILDGMGVSYIRNSRDIIPPNKIDIYIPSNKLAIECNGEYFHSSRTKPILYHSDKRKKCEENGIRLINLFGKTILSDNKKIYSFIKSLIKGNKIKIFARKCRVFEISNAIAKPFFEKYHFQGFHYGQKHYGLFYKNRIVSAISIGKSRFVGEKEDIEILRYVNMNNIFIIGGFEKILSVIKKDFSGKTLHTYSDLNLFTGEVYKRSGFSFVRDTPPDYYYFKDKNNSFSRYQSQKHKLKNILGKDFDPSETEEQNMNRCGYYRVYGCGNKYFFLQL